MIYTIPAEQAVDYHAMPTVFPPTPLTRTEVDNIRLILRNFSETFRPQVSRVYSPHRVSSLAQRFVGLNKYTN